MDFAVLESLFSIVERLGKWYFIQLGCDDLALRFYNKFWKGRKRITF